MTHPNEIGPEDNENRVNRRQSSRTIAQVYAEMGVDNPRDDALIKFILDNGISLR